MLLTLLEAAVPLTRPSASFCLALSCCLYRLSWPRLMPVVDLGVPLGNAGALATSAIVNRAVQALMDR